MNDIIIVLCGLTAISVLIAWMLRNDISFADFDAWWNLQFENFGAWFMLMASPFDDRLESEEDEM